MQEFSWILDSLLLHKGVQMLEHRLYPAIHANACLGTTCGIIAARCQLAAGFWFE